MGRLAGRVAFITGAARGLGAAIAVRLAAEGADIIATDLCGDVEGAGQEGGNLAELTDVAARITSLGRRVHRARVDVRDPDAVRQAVDDGVRALGRLDIVVANAGVSSWAPVRQLTQQQWQTVIDVNLTGVFNTVKATAQHLVDGQGGSVILVSSIAGLRALLDEVHYVAAKHGVTGMARALANEFGPHGIRVNSIHPTYVWTPMMDNPALLRVFRPDLDQPTAADVRLAFRDMHVLPVPWVELEDVANAVLWLASDEARYITGVALPVDAGATQKVGPSLFLQQHRT
jgi:SDR family mycofactocin-dependent oxidoreductase